MIKIYVDADACPVKDIILKVAKQLCIEVIMFVDTSHILESDYAQILTVDRDIDSVDFAIANAISANDIAVTQDYGLASLLLAKKVCVINQNGFLYTLDNIDRLLFERYIVKKSLRAGINTNSHIKKRTKENDLKFEQAFWDICKKQLELDKKLTNK